MNPSEQEIESVLRHAPQPKPPAGLKKELMAQVKLSVVRSESPTTVMMRAPGSWLRRWWPALAPATASLALTVVIAVQQTEIRDLKESIQTLFQANARAAVPTVPAPSNIEAPALDPGVREQQEISRLKALVRQLAAEVGQLERVQKENESLRTQLATRPTGLPQEILDAQEQFQKARDRAMEIACVNNLKQFGLAVRQWGLDNNDTFPPDVVCMSNELATPKVLVCPADTNRPVAINWAAYTAAHCSYEYLAPSVGSFTEPNRVLSRCPIHGTIGLCDGSVQRVGKEHPEFFVERDGKLYYEPKAQNPKP